MFLVFVYFALLRLTSALQHEGSPDDSSDCHTPDIKDGKCITIDQCPDLVSLAHQMGSFSILKRSGCGFEGDTPKVCCPTNIGDIHVEESTEPTYSSSDSQEPTTRRGDSRPDGATTRRITNLFDWFAPPRRTTKNNWITTTTRRTTTSDWMTTTRRSTNQSGGNRDVISTHRNYNLLPHDHCGPASSNRILGGSESDIEEFPWMTLLNYRYASGRTSFGCGGSLISDRYILTAAHCVKGLQNMKLVSVRLGEYDISEDKDCVGDVCSMPVQDLQLEDIISHEKYDPKERGQYNDIALLRLKTKANLNKFVQPICLPSSKLLRKSYDGTKLTVAGWGKTSNDAGSESNVKMKVNVPVVPTNECRRYYDKNQLVLRSTQMCAGGEAGKDSCQGDSGGPLMSSDLVNNNVRYHVTGVVSLGPKCGTYPAIYTKVAEYVPWILDNIRK